MSDTPLTYQVEFQEYEEGSDDGVQRFVGTISIINQDKTTALAGRIELRLVDTQSSSWSIFDILDCEMGLAEQLSISRRSGSSKAVENLIELDPDFDEGSFIVIDRLEVHPDYRGYDLGLHAIDEAVEQLNANCRWTILMPFPLSSEVSDLEMQDQTPIPRGGLQLEMFATSVSEQWVDSLRLNEFTSDIKAAVCALKRYYAKSGFISLRGTALMVKHLLATTEALEPVDGAVEEVDLELAAA